MTIKKAAKGWLVDIQPGGRAGSRLRKTFPTKAEAIAWEHHIQSKVQVDAEWRPTKHDSRRLSDLITSWFNNHGAALKDGAGRKRILDALCKALGDPNAEQFTASQFSEYRMRRINSGIKPNTLNHEHAYLRAVFNESIRLQLWKKENPLTNLRAFKIDDLEMSFLSLEQISTLLTDLKESDNPSAYLMAKTSLSTGGRWGEIEGLRISQVKNGQIQFVQTKSSRSRFVPISTDLEQELVSHHKENDQGENIFVPAYSAFRYSLNRVKLKLSDGQLTHILRHSFASHFMMNGGNILSLQKLLGHHSLAMTVRYAHLAPDHLQEAKKLNPIAALSD